jgi:hypothetical protein
MPEPEVEPLPMPEPPLPLCSMIEFKPLPVCCMPEPEAAPCATIGKGSGSCVPAPEAVAFFAALCNSARSGAVYCMAAPRSRHGTDAC